MERPSSQPSSTFDFPAVQIRLPCDLSPASRHRGRGDPIRLSDPSSCYLYCPVSSSRLPCDLFPPSKSPLWPGRLATARRPLLCPLYCLDVDLLFLRRCISLSTRAPSPADTLLRFSPMFTSDITRESLPLEGRAPLSVVFFIEDKSEMLPR